MKKEVMKKWTAGLRSGEYKQGITFLNRNNEQFCVMGVLCEIAVKDGINLNKEQGWIPSIIRYNGHESGLPDIVRQYAEMKTVQGYVPRGSGKTGLTHLNDIGKSFSEIADIIEANWEQL